METTAVPNNAGKHGSLSIKELLHQTDEILADYKREQSELIPLLQRVQAKFGYLPEESLQRIASYLNIAESTVFGVATFYAQFKLVPSGRNTVRVCRGTACHVKGGARVLKEVEKRLAIKSGESTPDMEFGLETVACIGACALAPTMTLNNKTFGQMNSKKVFEVFKTVSHNTEGIGK